MIDVQSVRERERALSFGTKWESDGGKMLAHQAKQLHGRETDPELTAEQEAEVVSRMAGSGGPRAVEELRVRIAEAEARAKLGAGLFLQGNQRPSALPMVREQVRKARTYRARLAAIEHALAVRNGEEIGDPPANPPTPLSELEEIHAVMLAGAGQPYLDALRSQCEVAVEELRARLAEVVTGLQETDSRHASRSLADHDDVWRRYAWLVWRKADLERRLASLEQDRSQARSVQASLTREAIAGAGGPEAIAGAIRQANLLARTWYETHPDHSKLTAAEAEAQRVDAELARLDDDGGALVAQVRKSQATAAGQVAAIKGRIDRDLRAATVLVVNDALAGDEQSRAAIEATARSEPRAFPAGFADAVAGAQFERSQLGALVHESLETSGRPMA